MVPAEVERRRTEARIAVVLFLTVLSAYLARVSLSVALPFVAADFDWTEQQIGSLGGVLLGIFLVGYGLSNIFISPLADCYGPRKGIMISVAAWSLLTLLTGLVGMYYSVFVLLRVSVGLSQGVVFPSAGKITQAWFPPERASRMNSIYYSAIALSNILSPLLLLPLILMASWNVMFVVLAISGFALLVPIVLWLRDSPEGAAVCEQKGLRENVRYTLANLKEASKLKGLPILIVSHALESIVFWGLCLWLPTFLMMARGFSRDELIWAVALPYVGYLVGLVVGSYLSDRTGRRSEVTGLFCAIGSLALVLMTQLTGRGETLLALGIVFFAVALVGPNIATLLQGCCVSRLTCSATGIENGIANGLGTLGPVLVGLTVAATASYSAALLLLAVLLVASGLVIVRFRIHERSTCPVPVTGQGERLS